MYPVWNKQIGGKTVDSLAMLTESGNFWVYKEDGRYWELIRSFGVCMRTFSAVDEDGELTTAFVGNAGVYFYDNRRGIRVSGITRCEPIGCYFLGRIFCAQNSFTLLFSAPFSPLDFTDTIDGGGRINLPSDRGKLLEITPLKNKIYLFFEWGISVLTPMGSARDFQIKDVVYRGGRILQGSVGVVNARGGEAFFLAEDGAYSFDGARCLRICKNCNILPKRGGQVCKRAVFENTYFVVYEDEKEVKRGLAIDGETAEGYPCFPMDGLSEYCGSAMCSFEYCAQTLQKNGGLTNGEERSFCAGGLTLGEAGLKCLQKLTVYGEGEVELVVESGKKSKRFILDLREGEACVNVFLRGRKFSLAFTLKEDAKVTAVSASVESLAGMKERG